LIEKESLVKGKSATGEEITLARVVDLFLNSAYVLYRDKVLRCNIKDLRLI
jgi:hypothetical protein